jgi:hypothetical protein
MDVDRWLPLNKQGEVGDLAGDYLESPASLAGSFFGISLP